MARNTDYSDDFYEEGKRLREAEAEWNKKRQDKISSMEQRTESTESAYQEGWSASCQFKSYFKDCPYKYPDQRAKEWHRGYSAANHGFQC